MQLSYNQKILLANGGLWSVFEALTAAFLTAFALTMGASNMVIGILGAIPFLGMIASELPGVVLMNYWRRRTIFKVSTIAGRLLWLALLLSPVLIEDNPVYFLVGVYFLSRFFTSLADPSWTSLAADLIPDKRRGRFFSQRLFWIGLLGMAAFFGGGVILDQFPKDAHTGFAIIFVTGIVFGVGSSWIMGWLRVRDQRLHQVHTVRDVMGAWRGDFGKFLGFSCFFNLAYMIASPFFAVYMLKNLGMSYTFYAAANAIGMLSRLGSQMILGPLSDRDGDKPVAMLCVFGTAIVPFVYLFIRPDTLWLVIPAEILSGLVWGGVELSLFNLLLDHTSKDDRPFQVAEFHTISAIPMIAGPVLGGFIADNVSVLGWSGIPIVFAVSFVLRGVSVAFLSGIPERRGPEGVPVWVVLREAMSWFGVHGIFKRVMAVTHRKA